VQLRASNDDAVGRALHDAYVCIGIVLQTRAPAAVAFRVGDALRDAHVALLRILHVRADACGVLRQRRFDAVGGRKQGHDRRVSDVR